MDADAVSWDCGGELQCWGAAGSPPPSGSGSGGLCSPALHRLDGKYTLLILCHPCSSAHLGVLWEGGCKATMPCQPWRERARGNEFSVTGSSRAGASKDESHPICKRLPKGFENNPLHRVRERVNATGSTERLPPARACSQHERRHSTLTEPGPGYKGLATRVLIQNASVNTFIFPWSYIKVWKQKKQLLQTKTWHSGPTCDYLRANIFPGQLIAPCSAWKGGLTEPKVE